MNRRKEKSAPGEKWSFHSCGNWGADGPTLAQCQKLYKKLPWVNDSNRFDVQNGTQIVTLQRDGIYEMEVSGAANNPTKGSTGSGTVLYYYYA